MIRVVVLAATKGGVGKSTLCCALAVAAMEDGERVALMDCDPQGSTTNWHQLRGNPKEPLLLASETVADGIQEAKAAGVTWLFVDTPPAVLNVIEPAVVEGRLGMVLVPVRPSPVDLLAIDPIVGLCREYDLPWAFVLNQVPARTAFAEDAAKQLKKAGRVLTASIGSRNAFVLAMARGQSGPEYERSDGKAREEIDALWREVKRRVMAHAK